ncbi:unnamed protein product [Lupinus luteus]|uniref:GBF-interacting protein 1 N-terminal domain-containing protein n=1 Tax=Lupinus luteus TaxID=3873 RepID=A0AAV1YPQ6_LUPLU
MSSIDVVSSRVRVSIPNNIRKTIQHIREITGKQHTDDEIYAVLRECSMDPNDTAQKLLYLDAFHEVTRRRDRKKEGLGSEGLEDSNSRIKRGHGRRGRVASSGNASNFSDGGGGRKLASRRENGIHNITERSRERSSQPGLQKIRKNPTSQPIRASVAYNDPVSQSNGNSGHGFSNQSIVKAAQASDIHMQSSAELRQHVTFPNHFHVPETLKAGLTFGSFDNFGPRERSSSGGGDNNTDAALKSSPGSDETATYSNQTSSLSSQGDHTEHPHSPSKLIEKTQALGNSITVVSDSNDQPKLEVLLAPDGLPIHNVQIAQNYGLNFMPTILRTQEVRFEGAESQAQETSHLPNFVSASSQTVSSPSPTPPMQSSIPVCPHSIPIFRPPYPPNFFLYGHYYPPIYLSPMHQFLSHNGFPPQPSVANMYLPPPAAGIKYPVPQFKAGANTGAMAHTGIPPASFIIPPAGYAPSPTLNTGNSNGNEDRAVSQSKENHIYTTGQLSEGSAVCIPAPSQDISNLHVNPLYNLSPQGHFVFPPIPSNHGAFAGAIYQPGQMVASPSTLLQQSQVVAGPVETVGPPSSAYQQPQYAQINLNSNS